MVKFIDKNTYLAYSECAKNAWLKFNKFDELRALFEVFEPNESYACQAIAVELEARKLFPNGVLIEACDKKVAALLTQQYLELKTQILFGSTFIHNEFLVVADVLIYDNQTKCWNLYGITSKSGLDDDRKRSDKEEIIRGLTFQAVILKKMGIELGEIFIISLNKAYVRDHVIDIEQLFVIDKVTCNVSTQEDVLQQQMSEMSVALLEKDEAEVECKCIYKGRSKHCPTFAYSHSYVPAYSVHDLASIGKSKKSLAMLVDAGVFKITDIPDNFYLTEKQKNQTNSCKLQRALIDHEAITKELATLAYPLYFLDYETYAPAIPMFKGFRPHLPITFQFSLHVLHSQEAEPMHYEYLHEIASDPSLAIIQKLQEFIGSAGTILVWYKPFECGRHNELAERHVLHQEFLKGLNNRVYDLMEVFSKQLYVHPNFYGSASIKKVLPALVPELNYKDLEIQEGETASQKWFDMVYGGLTREEKQKIAYNLRQYCKLDTYAMYAIWRYLINTCASCHFATHETCAENVRKLIE